MNPVAIAKAAKTVGKAAKKVAGAAKTAKKVTGAAKTVSAAGKTAKDMDALYSLLMALQDKPEQLETLLEAARSISAKSKPKGTPVARDPNKKVPYGPSRGEIAALDIGLPIIGDLAHFTGNATGTYHSLLGEAMAAMSQTMGNRTGALDTPNYMAPALAEKAKGVILTDLGDTIANRAYTTADRLKRNNAEKRNKEYQEGYYPNGDFWHTVGYSQANRDYPVAGNRNK